MDPAAIDTPTANRRSLVIARPPPLAEARRRDGGQSLPPRGRQAPRSATAARRSHRPRRRRPGVSTARSRAMRARMGSSRAGPAAGDAATDDDAADAERQGERSDRPREVLGHPVGDLDRERVAARRWRGRRPRRSGWDGRMVGDRQPSPRRPGGRSPVRRRSSRGSRAARRRRRRPPGRPWTWPTSPAKPLSPRSSAPSSTMPAEMPVPIAEEGDVGRRLGRPVRRRARSATAPPPGRRARRRRGCPSRPRAAGPAEVGDAQVDRHADRALDRVDLAGDGDADGGQRPGRAGAARSSTSPAIWADERRPVGRRDVLVEDAVAIVGDDDRGLGAADIDAGDQRPRARRRVRSSSHQPQAELLLHQQRGRAQPTTSSWTWPSSICVSRASSVRALDPA